MNDILIQLARTSLTCRLDTPIEGLPDDLIEGSYRWRLYVYSNVEKSDLSPEEKSALISVSEKLRDEHLICWTRHKLFALRENDISVVRDLLNQILNSTRDAAILRICIYALRMLNKKFYIVDPIMVEAIPDLLKYTK
jgi:hypothetical protein